MISHERRLSPMRLWVALCVLCTGCEVHETVWTKERGTPVEPGTAVEPWQDAQLVVRPEDAAAPGVDASAGDAASEGAAGDAAVGDGGLDSSTQPPDDTAGIDTRCVFRVTTLPLGGRYAPKNIAAVWIERMDGSWVKTLALWAGVRLRYLTEYRRANPTGNKVDAVTSATMQGFGPRVVGWNLDDAQRQEVPPGDYVVKVELTDRDAPGQVLAVPFTKSEPPFVSTLPDTQFFTGAQLRCR